MLSWKASEECQILRHHPIPAPTLKTAEKDFSRDSNPGSGDSSRLARHPSCELFTGLMPPTARNKIKGSASQEKRFKITSNCVTKSRDMTDRDRADRQGLKLRNACEVRGVLEEKFRQRLRTVLNVNGFKGNRNVDLES